MISVAIPAVKTNFLMEAIESVLNQTFSDFELIIVNDASKEDVKGIVNCFVDKRIRYYENDQNMGIVKNWNKCLDLARGEYFILFSDDDIYEPNFFFEMVQLAVKYPQVDLFHCRVKIVNEYGLPIDYSSSCPEYESAVNFLWHRQKRYRKQFVADFMSRTSALREKGGFIDFPHAWSSDDATWFTLANPNGVVATSKILCSWRQSRFHVSRLGNLNSRLVAVNLYEKWLMSFISNVLFFTDDEKELCESLNLLAIKADLFTKADLLLLSADGSFFSIFKPILLFLKSRNINRIRFKSLLVCYAKLFNNQY